MTQFDESSVSDPNSSSAAICLVIAYYEEGENLQKTLASVYLDAEDSIVVVDDGSTELPARGFCPDSANGTPIKLVELPHNMGVAEAARIGVLNAPREAEYIARLDCRDVNAADRFALQRDYLDKHPDCGIVGSSVSFHDPSGRLLYLHEQPEDDADIRNLMRVNCAFTQPTVLFRRSAYDRTEGYSNNYPWAEDYALFRDLLTISKGHNFRQPLVSCSTMDGGISQKHRRRQLLSRAKIILKYWDWHPRSIYGLLRAVAQLITTRNFTSRVKRSLAWVRELPTRKSNKK